MKVLFVREEMLCNTLLSDIEGADVVLVEQNETNLFLVYKNRVTSNYGYLISTNIISELVN